MSVCAPSTRWRPHSVSAMGHLERGVALAMGVVLSVCQTPTSNCRYHEPRSGYSASAEGGGGRGSREGVGASGRQSSLTLRR